MYLRSKILAIGGLGNISQRPPCQKDQRATELLSENKTSSANSDVTSLGDMVIIFPPTATNLRMEELLPS